MTIHSLVFTYTQIDDLEQLIAELVDGRGQFSVCPFPDDLMAVRRTGWKVSWIPQETRREVAA